MSDIEVADTMADLAKKSGLKNYLWLYFLIVPLAASTASAIAIIIAALQGLSQHELAAQIYAKTLIIGFKTIGSISAAYITGLLLALASIAVHGIAKSSLTDRRARISRELVEYHKNVAQHEDDEVPGDLGDYQFMMEQALLKQERRQQVFVVAAVLYSAVLLVASFFWLMRDDAQDMWNLVSRIAAGSGSEISVEVTEVDPDRATHP